MTELVLASRQKNDGQAMVEAGVRNAVYPTETMPQRELFGSLS
jgi:hypothetical protein